MTARSEVGVGDLIRALRALRVSDERTGIDISRLLGLLVPCEMTDMAPPLEHEASESRTPQPPVAWRDTKSPPVVIKPWTREDMDSSKKVELMTSKEPGMAERDPDWVDTTPALELPRGPEPLPPLEPLLTPRWTRSILTALLALEVDEGPPDVRRAIERLVRRESLHRLPREPLRALRRGVQVLLDRGEGMELFSRDQAHLVGSLERVMGCSRMEVLNFVGCPSRGASRGPRSPRPRLPTYQPPAVNVPLLLVTDFGIGATLDSAGEEEWLAFTHEMHRRGHPLFALVPYPPDRWLRRLQGQIRIVSWDRSTTVGSVHAASKYMRHGK